MGPQELEDVARDMANRHGAKFESIVGDQLLQQNFPSIHAVGRASHRAPRLLRLDWRDDAHEPVVLVGKGVCFDTAGLDINGADGMRHMRKDMGGSAHALALPDAVMARQLTLRAQLRLPAAETDNAPQALRPRPL